MSADWLDALLDPVLKEARAAFVALKHGAAPAVQAEIDAVLESWPALSPSHPPTPVPLPACAWLGAALAASSMGPLQKLGAVLTALGPSLRWTFGYAPDPRWPDIGEKVAFAQIVGDQGLRAGEKLHIGLTLMAPETHYPLHTHPAIELYLVLSGHALWQAGQAEPHVRRPGSIILHADAIPHAMTTGAEPLLALFTWRGDLGSPSRFLA